MSRLPLEQQFILIGQTALLLALCIRFVYTGLYRIYSYFFTYFLLALLQSAIPQFVPLDSKRYLQIYMLSEGVVVCCYALVVLEEYSSILRGMAGVARVARQYIKITLTIAVIVSLLLVAGRKTPATLPQYFLTCERSVMAILLIFVLSSLIFLVYYPAPLSRNVVVYSIGFTVYLVSKAGGLFVAGAATLHPWIRAMNTFWVGTATACLLFWLVALNRQGEVRKVLLAHPVGPAQEKLILSRLQAINEGLMRTARK